MFEELAARLTAASETPEVRGFLPGLDLRIRFVVDGQSHDIACSTKIAAFGAPDISIAASASEWSLVLAESPRPTYHSFSSIQLRNPHFTVSGDPLRIAQARAFLEALFANLRPAKAVTVPVDLQRLQGRYSKVRTSDGQVAQIYSESAGRGSPVLCLHTAGADTRQFHGVMCDSGLGADWRFIGFDMPYHGRTLPPQGWNGGTYQLDQRTYLDWCTGFIEQVIGESVVVMGCSMGAGIAMVLAAERPDLVKAVIALEAPLRPRGRRNQFLTHAQVNGGWHSAAYVRGLMSPSSPAESRRQAAFIYAQGAPGIYDGDLAFYSDEFDGEDVAKRIDGKNIPVALLIGHYDFSATVEDAYKLAAWIEGATVTEMPELGHFPMTENPPVMIEYLRPLFAKLSLTTKRK